MLNRRANIGPLVLFVGALIVAIAFFFTALSTERFTSGIGGEYDTLSQTLASDRAYVNELFKDITQQSIKEASGDFKASFLERFTTLHAHVAAFSGARGDYFGIIREKDPLRFQLIEVGDREYELTIRNVTLYRKAGESEARAQFDLNVRFNQQGLIE